MHVGTMPFIYASLVYYVIYTYSYTLVHIIYEAKQRITDLYHILPVPVNTLMTSYLSLVVVN